MNQNSKSVPPNDSVEPDQRFIVEPKADTRFSAEAISPITHNFHLHPLMQLDKLKQLADFLMERNQCRFVAPDIKQDSAFTHHDKAPDGSSLAEVFERIHEPRSWVALYNVEAEPEYQAFLDEVVDSIRPLIEPTQHGIFNIGGFIFISAPPSVTPFHIDRENNCWLQIKGQKRITVFDHEDEQVVPRQSVEQFIVNRNLDRVRLTEANAELGQEFNVGPGQGVYFPATTPHMTRTTDDWVQQSDGISISIGVVFYTEHTRRQAQIHQCNAVLRRLGLDPSPPGSSPLLDATKRHLGHSLAVVKKRFRGYNPPPGSY